MLREEIIYKGMGIGRGVAIGEAIFYARWEPMEIVSLPLAPSQVPDEIKRYRKAISECRKDLRKLHKQMGNVVEAVSIIETYIQMVEDPLLIDEVEGLIESKKENAEFVFHSQVKLLLKKFEKLADPFFQERSHDLQEVARRILGHLIGVPHQSLADIPPGVIVFSKEIIASDIVEAKLGNVLAFVTEKGGATSHAAIVAKANGVPYVSNVDFSEIDFTKSHRVIVNANKGMVIVDPAAKTVKRFKEIEMEVELHKKELERTAHLLTETSDGERIYLMANVEMMNEIDLLHRFGGDGVGLFRTEFLFLLKQNFPSEEEQVSVYRRFVEKMKGLPITFRTYDVGGDKLTDEQRARHRTHPYFGSRAIRFLLQEKEIFKTHLKAIMRVSYESNLRIMFPMITCLTELLEAKRLLNEVITQLNQEGVKIAEKVPIGCMIEVPSAAMITDLLAKECDFLSIGTNDLIQYSLAADRSNQAMSSVYSPAHPSIMRLINLISTHARSHGVPVSICGEIAGDPLFIPLLIGLGIREFSVASWHLPYIKNAIHNTSFRESIELAQRVLMLGRPEEIQQVLIENYKRSVPNDADFASIF